MKIIKFALYERNDINIINDINTLYDELLSCVKNNIKECFISNGDMFLTIDNFVIPLIICFSKSNKNYSYGKVLVGSEKVEMDYLSVPIMDKLKNKPIEKLTFKDIYDNLSHDEKSMKHELTHLYDKMKFGTSGIDKGTKDPTGFSNKEYDEYFNNDTERNAYFISSSIDVMKYIEKGNLEVLDDFETFMEYMKFGNGQLFFDNLNKKNKKKYITRCYLLYKDLLEKYIGED